MRKTWNFLAIPRTLSVVNTLRHIYLMSVLFIHSFAFFKLALIVAYLKIQCK